MSCMELVVHLRSVHVLEIVPLPSVVPWFGHHLHLPSKHRHLIRDRLRLHVKWDCTHSGVSIPQEQNILIKPPFQSQNCYLVNPRTVRGYFHFYSLPCNHIPQKERVSNATIHIPVQNTTHEKIHSIGSIWISIIHSKNGASIEFRDV